MREEKTLEGIVQYFGKYARGFYFFREWDEESHQDVVSLAQHKDRKKGETASLAQWKNTHANASKEQITKKKLGLIKLFNATKDIWWTKLENVT